MGIISKSALSIGAFAIAGAAFWYLSLQGQTVNPVNRFYIPETEIPALESAAAKGDKAAIRQLAEYYELYRNGDPRARQYLELLKKTGEPTRP